MVNISDINITAPSLNFTYIQQNLITWTIQGYTGVFGGFFWALLFSGVIIYIYVKNASLVTAAVGIMIIFAGFGTSSVMLGIPAFTAAMQLIVAAAIAGLVTVYLTRRRGY